MADNRTGLSATDIAESFRDRCGDGSVEWVYTPTQTWVLLDAADMLDENTKLVMKLNAEHLVRQNVERENAELRELVADMYKAFAHGNCYRWCEFKEPCNYITDGKCQWYDRMRELGVDA